MTRSRKLVLWLPQFASDQVDRLACVGVVLTGGGVFLLVFAGVVARYGFGTSIRYGIELSRLLFVWSAFLSATVVYRRKAHVRFEFLNHLLGARGVALTDLLLYLAAMWFFWTTFEYASVYRGIVWGRTFAALPVSQGWMYISLIVSSVIFLIHTIRLLLEAVFDFIDIFIGQRHFSNDGADHD